MLCQHVLNKHHIYNKEGNIKCNNVKNLELSIKPSKEPPKLEATSKDLFEGILYHEI